MKRISIRVNTFRVAPRRNISQFLYIFFFSVRSTRRSFFSLPSKSTPSMHLSVGGILKYSRDERNLVIRARGAKDMIIENSGVTLSRRKPSPEGRRARDREVLRWRIEDIGRRSRERERRFFGLTLPGGHTVFPVRARAPPIIANPGR